MSHYIKSSYLCSVLDKRRFSAALKKAKIKLKGIKFDSIVVTGNSGTIFGGALAYTLKKSLILIRKKGVDSHSWRVVEGNANCKKWIFVDDCVCSGNSRDRCGRWMKTFCPFATYMGIYLYNDNKYLPPTNYMAELKCQEETLN